jgi:hypothetical protein
MIGGRGRGISGHGLLNGLQPVLAPQAIEAEEDELLERYATHEAALEAGEYLA